MFDCHELIAHRGLLEARKIAANKGERMAVDAAAAILFDSENAQDFVYASLGVCALPHKNTDSRPVPWQYVGDDATYLFRDGILEGQTPVGVPYGSKARLILLYLQNAAIRSRSRTIELGSSLYWLTRSAHPKSIGGMSYRLIMKQAMRIVACRLAIDGKEATYIDTLVQPSADTSACSAPPGYLRDKGASVMPQFAILNEAFYNSFIDSAVPIRLSALRQLSNNSVAIDLYIWLCHRLPALNQPQFLDWAVLANKFGGGYKEVRHMRRPFLNALRLALAVYPEAMVEKNVSGLTLHPSNPPVSMKLIRCTGTGAGTESASYV